MAPRRRAAGRRRGGSTALLGGAGVRPAGRSAPTRRGSSVAVLLQGGTYLAQGGIWRRVGVAAGYPLSYKAAFELGLAKLFADQALPSAGVSSSVLIATGARAASCAAGRRQGLGPRSTSRRITWHTSWRSRSPSPSWPGVEHTNAIVVVTAALFLIFSLGLSAAVLGIVGTSSANGSRARSARIPGRSNDAGLPGGRRRATRTQSARARQPLALQAAHRAARCRDPVDAHPSARRDGLGQRRLRELHDREPVSDDGDRAGRARHVRSDVRADAADGRRRPRRGAVRHAALPRSQLLAPDAAGLLVLPSRDGSARRSQPRPATRGVLGGRTRGARDSGSVRRRMDCPERKRPGACEEHGRQRTSRAARIVATGACSFVSCAARSCCSWCSPQARPP